MAKESASSPTATPPSAALKRTSSSTQNMKSQKSILGFFQKSSPATPSTSQPREPASSPAQRASEQRGPASAKQTPRDQKRSFSSFAQDLSPVPSSDLPVPEDETENDDNVKVCVYVCQSIDPELMLLGVADRERYGPGQHNVSLSSGMSPVYHLSIEDHAHPISSPKSRLAIRSRNRKARMTTM